MCVVDLVDAFQYLKVRQPTTKKAANWVDNNHSVSQFEAILQNKLHLDQKALAPLQSADCVDINRFQTSVTIHQLVKAYDLYLVSMGYLTDQIRKTTNIFSNIFADIASRRVTDHTAPPGLLKYIIVRHPGRGNLMQLHRQPPFTIPAGLSGLCMTPQTSRSRFVSAKRLRMSPNSTLTETPRQANSRPATFDLLSEHDSDEVTM